MLAQAAWGAQFNNNGSDNWINPSGWINESGGGGVPGSGDTAQISTGTMAVNDPLTIGTLHLFGGGIAGTGTLTIVGTGSQWTGGTMNSSGTLVISSGSDFEISGTSLKDFNSHTLTNQGTVNWQAGTLRSGNGALITNSGTWNDTASGQFNNDYNNGWTFNNTSTGTYNKTAAGTTTFGTGVNFNNSGAVNVTGGTLLLQGGGAFTGGTLTAGSGALISISSNFSASGTVTFGGAGTVRLASGTFSGTHTLEGPLEWTAGNFNGAGTTTFGTTSVLSITTSSNHDFNQHSLVNNGTVNWTGGQIRAGNGASFTNNGTLNDSADSNFNNDYANGWTFTNASGGTYNKTSPGTTTFATGVTFNNTGQVNVTGGILQIQGGGELAGGTITAGASGIVEIESNVTGNGTVTLNGPGEIRFNSGNFTGTTTFQGPLHWYGGTFNGAGSTTFGSGATIAVTGTGNHDFNQRSLVNNGTVNWTGGQIRAGNGASFTNNATFNDSSGSNFNNDYANGWTFINPAGGTYNKSGTGTTTFATGVALNNAGQINVTGGTLLLQGGGNLAGGTVTVSSGATLQIASSFNNPGTVTFSGAGAVNFTAGTFTGTTTFQGPLHWYGGTFNGAGSTTFGSGATIAVTGTGNHDFNQRSLVNNGTVNWTGGQIRAGNGASFTNNATFNDSSGSNFNNDYANGWTFINPAGGTYNKSGTGTTTFATGVALNNAGQINVTGGTLLLQGGGNLAGGTVTVSSGATLQIASSFNNPGTVTFSGAGAVNFTAGTFTGTTTFEGPMNWSTGNFNGAGTTTFGSGATIAVTGAGNHDFNQRTLVNNGTVNWNDGPIRAGNGASFVNNGTFNDLSIGDPLNNDYANGWSFTNALSGVFSKGAAGTTTFASGVAFTNNGTLSISYGTLAFQNSPVLDDGGIVKFVLSGTTPGSDFGLLSVAGSLALDGTLQVKFSNGFDTLVSGGDTFTLVTATSLTGSFVNVANGGRLITSDGLGSFQVNFGSGSVFSANSVVVSNFQAIPEPSTWALMAAGGAMLGARLLRRRR